MYVIDVDLSRGPAAVPPIRVQISVFKKSELLAKTKHVRT